MFDIYIYFFTLCIHRRHLGRPVLQYRFAAYVRGRFAPLESKALRQELLLRSAERVNCVLLSFHEVWG